MGAYGILFILLPAAAIATNKFRLPEQFFQPGDLMDAMYGPNETARFWAYSAEFQSHGKKLGEWCNRTHHEIISNAQDEANEMVNNASTGEPEEIEGIRRKFRENLDLTLSTPNYCAFNPFWYHNETELYCNENSTCVLVPHVLTNDTYDVVTTSTANPTTITTGAPVILEIPTTHPPKCNHCKTNSCSREALSSFLPLIPLVVLLYSVCNLI